MTTLRIGNFEVTLNRKRIKNINLRIAHDGTVHVSAPLRLSIAIIQEFIEQKHSWIAKHQTQILAKPKPKQLSLNHGDAYPLLGQDYELVICESPAEQRIDCQPSTITCYIKNQASFAMKKQLFQNWHREHMLKLLTKLLKKWEPVIGVAVKAWGVKPMKSRWGSCNPSSRTLWINLQLIHEPLPCLEYVLVHELVHLLEASHNQRFHALMSTFLPEWRTCKNQLRHTPLFT